MVEARTHLFLAARQQFLMWGSAHRPRQTAHMNYVCLSLLLYVSLWLIFEKSFWQSSNWFVFRIVKSSGRCDFFSFLFFPFYPLFLAQFYPQFTIKPRWTRCGRPYEITTANRVACTRDQARCQQPMRSRRGVESNLRRWRRQEIDSFRPYPFVKRREFPREKKSPITLLIRIDPACSVNTDID